MEETKLRSAFVVYLKGMQKTLRDEPTGPFAQIPFWMTEPMSPGWSDRLASLPFSDFLRRIETFHEIKSSTKTSERNEELAEAISQLISAKCKWFAIRIRLMAHCLDNHPGHLFSCKLANLLTTVFQTDYASRLPGRSC